MITMMMMMMMMMTLKVAHRDECHSDVDCVGSNDRERNVRFGDLGVDEY